MSNGDVEQKQQSHTGKEVERIFTGRVSERVHGESPAFRATGQYTYRLVHTQESLRMLDLRLDIAELQDVAGLRVILDAIGRDIIYAGILFEIECLANGH